MRLVLSQPMLMPWKGMFDQMQLCDRFVFYDDVQLPLGGGRGRGFITRVQVKTPQGVDWLSLPVSRANAGKQDIQDALFAHQDWRAEHLGKLAQAYKAAPHYRKVFGDLLEPLYAFRTDSVSEFCMQSMKLMAAMFGLPFEPAISSTLDVPRDLEPSARVLEFCLRAGADEYVSGLGAMDYINYDLFERNGVRILYMAYDIAPWPQLHGAFTPFVSAIDLLFNLGPEAADRLGSRAVYWRDWPHMQNGRPTRLAG